MAMTWPGSISSAGVASGIKDAGALDVGVLVAPAPVSWAGTFTKNAAAAACVGWCRERLGSKVRAIVVNSGNANACTGPAGRQAVESVAEAAARELGCSPDEILIASTGPIGVELPTVLVTDALGSAVASLSPSTTTFARAIITTDTHTKAASAQAGPATVVGIAKGAAMVAPNMATMLAFLVTDAAVPESDLQPLLTTAVGQSFDRISVDACESTNDSVFLLAGGTVTCTSAQLAAAVRSVCADLAEQIVRDAEGASKFVRIQVTGARDELSAVAAGRAVAGSALWKAAMFGADPNWGRVLSSLGRDRALDIEEVSIAIGSELVFDHGAPSGSVEAAGKAMEGDEFTVACVLGRGPGNAEVLTCDLTPDYVVLNAGGST